MEKVLLFLVICIFFLNPAILNAQDEQDTLKIHPGSYIDSVTHRYPFINIHLAGVPLLTSRYNFEINVLRGLYIKASYGNKLFDFLHLALTTDQRYIGVGANYKFGINQKRTSFITINLNEYLRFNLEPSTYPKKDIYSMATIGYFHVGKKKPISYFFNAGPVIRTSLKDQYSKGYTSILGLIGFDVGIGYSFYKTYRK
jgi:hypothetical protein